MHGDDGYHLALLGVRVYVVEIKVSSHDKVPCCGIWAGESAASGSVGEAEALRSRHGVEEVSGHEVHEAGGAGDAGVEGLVKFVVYIVGHFVDASAVALEIYQRVNHAALGGIFDEDGVVFGGGGCGARVVVAAGGDDEGCQYDACKQQGRR